MAVERKKEFVLDLSDEIKARLESFNYYRNNIRAGEESEFQRRVVDEDLSFQDRVEYREAQLGEEKKRKYLDQNYIDELKTKVTELKKLARQRKFRNAYFQALSDRVAGRKSMEDFLSFLEDSMGAGYGRETEDKIQELMINTREDIKERDRQIVNSKLKFYGQEKTQDSLNKAEELIKKEMKKLEVQKNPALKNSYELQLRSLAKDKMEVAIEDKAVEMTTDLLGEEKENPPLWKIQSYRQFSDSARTDIPVTIGNVRYDSERDYWQAELNDYIQNEFALEYKNHIKAKTAEEYNRAGRISNDFLKGVLETNNQVLNMAELNAFPSSRTMAVQAATSSLLEYKSSDLTRKYNLDNLEIATELDIQNAERDMRNLEKMVGSQYYSLSPDIAEIEKKLVIKRTAKAESIITDTEDWMENYYTTNGRWPTDQEIKDYIATKGPEIAADVASEEVKKMSATELAETLFTEPGKVTTPSQEQLERKEELQKKKKELEEKVAEGREKKTKEAPEEAPKEEKKPELGEPIRFPEAGEMREWQEKYTWSPEKNSWFTRPGGVPAPKEVKPEETQPTKPVETPPKPRSGVTVTVPETPQQKIYKVKSGETLSGIAQKELGSGERWKELKTPAGKSFTEQEAKSLQVGQELILPSK